MKIPPELRRLGAAYSKGTEEFQRQLKATMTENPIFDQQSGRLHRPGPKIPVVTHTVKLSDYAAQLRTAGKWEEEFLAGLKANGWQWDEVCRHWFHPDRPRTYIEPG